MEARAAGVHLLVPAGADVQLAEEIKQVITAGAETTHYWADHVPNDAKRVLMLTAQLTRMTTRVRRWFSRHGR